MRGFSLWSMFPVNNDNPHQLRHIVAIPVILTVVIRYLLHNRIMEFLKKLNLQNASVPKMMGVCALGLVAVAIVLASLNTARQRVSGNFGKGSFTESFTGGFASDEASYNFGAPAPSARSYLPSPLPPSSPPFIYPPDETTSTGRDAEQYEITSYTATVKSANSKRTCASIEALKPKEYIIFESANNYDEGCSYQFKVPKENTDEILEFIRTLDPKTLSRNTHTIKKIIEYHTTEVQILEKKLAAVEEILNQALEEYNEIGAVAKSEGDAESLTKIIDSKVQLIERLTNERMNVLNQVTALNRTYAENLDRLEYTVFSVSVFEEKLIDFEEIGDQWTAKVQSFFLQLNKNIQNMTLSLVGFLFEILVYILYAALLLFVGKYGWRIGKQFWNS